ncbi:metallo-beta-lactamase superfamily protein PA0057 [Rhodoferax lithotrophicus]|uniref:Metallo-beta-lactamase superfamily protein PA0057 n=1 Tax=Rhodoferax lithotrophicus TaxID=2798804 RepID=A0ABN6D5N0_9BURK|nr:metallo-beta-lactamase superfamily protein PA0057 [Rhodoferax sp. MIZ03]
MTIKVYNAGATSVNVNSTLVYGEKEAMVIPPSTSARPSRITASAWKP